jgi:hypothetical protein
LPKIQTIKVIFLSIILKSCRAFLIEGILQGFGKIDFLRIFFLDGSFGSQEREAKIP